MVELEGWSVNVLHKIEAPAGLEAPMILTWHASPYKKSVENDKLVQILGH